MFSRLKKFVEENGLETSDTGIDQYIKDHLVNLQPKFF
jgi:effector-binding domain-containing protein